MKKLSRKLVYSLTVILVVAGAVSGIVQVRTQETQILEAMVQGADQLSGSVTSATWHAMLADQRGSAYEIMQTIATKQGISRIRIFNKEGKIMFSTVPGDTGQVDKDAEACAMCHSSLQPLVRVDAPSRARVYSVPGSGRRLAMVSPIYNEPACSAAPCHAHPAGTNVLGVLDVALSLDQVDATLAGIRLRIFLVTSILILCLALFVLSFTKRFVEVPIRRLTNAARAVSAMRLNEPVVVSSRDEIGELAVSFESMRLKLKAALDELARSAHTLEARIEERTDQLRVAHQKLRQSDRLASLGKLSASMAHEINNPVSGILNLGMLMQRILKQEGSCRDREEELRRYLTMVVSETERVGRIVKDLLAFSRRSSPRRDTLDLNAIVRSTVELVSHKINQMGVEVDLELADGVPVVCGDRSQMQEVLINLLMNAAEASQSEVGGHVAVRTRGDGESVTLEVEDNGEGIPPENLQKIFDPFFTTKEEGKGVGLGLSVVYGIIEAHQGDIDVSSGVGAGTTFTVRLPACRPGEAQCQDGGTT